MPLASMRHFFLWQMVNVNEKLACQCGTATESFYCCHNPRGVGWGRVLLHVHTPRLLAMAIWKGIQTTDTIYYFSILLSHIRITPCIGWSYLVPLSSIAKRAAPLAVDADLPGAQHTETKEYQWEVRLQYKLDASSTNMYERQCTGTNTL